MTDIILAIIFVITVLVLILILFLRNRKPAETLTVLNPVYTDLLEKNIPFYNDLVPTQKILFQLQVEKFLEQVRISGINTVVEDSDRIMIAASAIIPIFYFPGWEYCNLDEVLLYPDAFDENFRQEGTERNMLGVVGDGSFQRVMILSRHALREGFSNRTGKSNTAIHEFVHLVDKTDGAIDGIPQLLMENSYVLPWVELMRKNIMLIKEQDSDIDTYGATNTAEFFAVASEYFFERPDLLKAKHPELYETLSRIFGHYNGLKVSNEK